LWRQLLDGRRPVDTTPEAPPPDLPVSRSATPTADEFAFGPGPDDITGESIVERTDPSESTDVPEQTDPRVSEPDGGWYTEEVEWEGPPGPLFSPGDLDAADKIPESSLEAAAREEGSLDSLVRPVVPADDDLLEVEPIPLASSVMTADPSLGRPAWVDALAELVDLLAEMPMNDPGQLAV